MRRRCGRWEPPDSDHRALELGGAAAMTTWADGSLGCPVPGETDGRAPVPGYRILLEAGEATFDDRAAETGWFRLWPP